MAGRGGPKLKEYRQHVTSVRHWLKEIEYEGLINVAKLEEEQRHLMAEEEKKKAEMESVQRRKALNQLDGEGGDGTINADTTANNIQTTQVEEEETAAKIKTAWDKITIPKLEKYSGYDHPRPLWLLMKDGQVLYELNSANPPKLAKMIVSILTNTPLTEKELYEMDFHPDPAKKKRKKKPNKKTAAEQAAIAAKKRKAAKRAEKKDVVRPEEYLIQCKIADIHKNLADSAGKHPVLVLYTKDAASDDFTYYGQTERIRGDLNPVYHKSFHFLKSDVLPQIESGGDIELKFVLYDSDSDTISREHPPTILGDAYVHLKSLLGVDGEGGVVELKLKKHLPHPPSEKKTGRKNKGQLELEEEEAGDHGAGLLTLITKTRANEGVVTNYNLNLSAKYLPHLNKDSVGVAVPQPVVTHPDGTPLDPALIEEVSRRDYFIEFQLSDENSLRPGSVGITDNQHSNPNPVFHPAFLAPHHSKDDRTLTFLLYDGLAVDERFFDGLTNGLAYRKELIATASIKYDSFLTQRKQFKNLISLPWLDSNTGQQLMSETYNPETGGVQLQGAILQISADELNDDGSIEPFDPDEEVGAGAKEVLPEKIELALTLNGYERAPDAPDNGRQPLVAVFVQNLSGAFEFLGQTERAAQTYSDETGLTSQPFRKTFLVNAPTTKPISGGQTQPTNEAQEINADTSYQAFASASSSSSNGSAPGSTQASPRAPVPQNTRTNIYKFVVYDSETDDYTKGVSPPEIIGESIIELSKELLSMGTSHSLTLLDKTSTPLPNPKTTLNLNIQEVGSVSIVDLIFTAGGLVKSELNPGLLPNPQIKVYSSHKTLGTSLTLAGETEVMPQATDPSFLGKISLESYSAFSSGVTVIVYDAGGVDGEGGVKDEAIIGEVNFKLSDFLARSQASLQASPSGQPQPIEYKLVKIVKSADPAIPAQQLEVNGGLGVIRICDITPKPQRRAKGKKKKVRQPKVDANGNELSDLESEEEEEEDEEAELDEDLAVAAQAAVEIPEKELSKEEREFGTSPPMTDGSKIAFSISAQDIPKKDWLNDKYPFIALFKKTPSTGLYEYQDHTERIRDENDPKWEKIFLLDNPQGSQFYKVILLDAPRNLSVPEITVWSQAQSLSRPGVPSEKYETLCRQGGDADHLGESIIDVQKLLIRAEPQRFQDRFGVDVPKTVLHSQAAEIGNINALQLHLSASSLPRSELFNKTDPLVVLSARNPNTGEYNELTRTERLANDPNPTWSTPLQVDGYSKADRELRLAVYDSDPDPKQQSFTDRDLLGEASTTLNGLLAGPVVELKLTKGGKPVLVGETNALLSVRAAARGGAPPISAPVTARSSRPGTRPQSAVRQASHSSTNATGAAASSGDNLSARAPTLSRPVSATQKLEHNLAEKHHEEAEKAIAHAMELQSQATIHQAVEEIAHTAQEHQVGDAAPAHHLQSGEPTVGPPAAADATMPVPTPGGITSATATEPSS